MATAKTKAEVEFSAEISGFQNSINTLKKDITTLNNTLKLNAEKLKNDSTNVDLLNERKTLLNNKLLKVQEEVEAVNNKLQAQIATFGEDSTIVRSTTNELIKIQTQEQAVRNEIDKVTASLEKSSKELTNSKRSYEQLENTISNQKEELNNLRDEYRNLVLEQGKNSTEAKNLAQKIIELNNELKENEKSLQGVNEALDLVDETSSNASNGGFTVFKGVMSEMASSTIKECISGLKELSGEIIEVGKSFTSSMSQVEALSGATEDELKALEEKAKQLGSSTRFTASEVADGFSYMALAGWDTNDMLASISSVLNLAIAGNMDLAKASDIVTDYLTAFGLKANDAQKFVDQMAYAMSNSNTNVEQLGEAYKNVAATSTQLGYSLEDTTSALMVMANSGIKGGEAGTALASIMTRLGNDVSGCRKMLKDYGVEVYDSNGKVKSLSSILTGLQAQWNKLTDEQKSNLSYVVAGKTAQSELMTVLGDSEGTFMEYTKALEDCDGASQKMAQTMSDNLEGDAIALDSAVEGLGISIFEDFESPLRSVTNFITEDCVSSLTNLNNSTGLVSAAISGLATVLGILAIALGISVLISGVQKAMNLLNATLLANPIVLIVALIAGLVVAFISLWNNCEAFRNFFIGLWNSIKNAVSSAVQFIQNMFNRIKEIVISIASKIGSAISGAIKGAINGVLSMVESVINVPINAINGLLDIINKVPGINISKINQFKLPRLKVGIDYVPKDYYGPVYLDEGERVLTKEENKRYTASLENAVSNQVHGQTVISNSFEYERIDRACELLEIIANKDLSLSIDSEEIARATATADDKIAGDLVNLKNRGLEV